MLTPFSNSHFRLADTIRCSLLSSSSSSSSATIGADFGFELHFFFEVRSPTSLPDHFHFLNSNSFTTLSSFSQSFLLCTLSLSAFSASFVSRSALSSASLAAFQAIASSGSEFFTMIHS
ncbi:hypothetical protein M422DRAFT_263121 [Sphaerobolus stellatus SS14]|uniref:Uncharacterized protein n=1 Tax=Sphaerobolus stellatus (strain SS14) TaxID=990650 RepID=A0A0C9TWI7_SPHS4|nr:hypothetical protein M422DRAFT_263121 [Sphaerobolus stellatus SS14]